MFIGAYSKPSTDKKKNTAPKYPFKNDNLKY